MLTFEEAKRIALRANKKVDACREYQKAYHFFIKDSDADGDCGVIVMKKNGATKGFVQFIIDDSPETRPVDIPFAPDGGK